VLLIKNNINIHKIDSNNLNVIFKCILSNNCILLKYFINLGVNPNHLNSFLVSYIFLLMILVVMNLIVIY
jgi:hypothetical protein